MVSRNLLWVLTSQELSISLNSISGLRCDKLSGCSCCLISVAFVVAVVVVDLVVLVSVDLVVFAVVFDLRGDGIALDELWCITMRVLC